jgi:lysozyme
MMDKRKMMTSLAGLGLSVAACISGAFLVAPSEGDHPKTYLDPVNIVTDCYGHTGGDVKLGHNNTDQECLNKLAVDLVASETSVDNVIKVPLTPYQKAALISFTYNVGENNLAKSTLAKDFNNKQYVKGCTDLLSWVYAKKQKLPGLVARRKLEYDMCMGELHVANT